VGYERVVRCIVVDSQTEREEVREEAQLQLRRRPRSVRRKGRQGGMCGQGRTLLSREGIR
jgi:hypothetical protein